MRFQGRHTLQKMERQSRGALPGKQWYRYSVQARFLLIILYD
jgi:hypothetical protein